jgi:hypothetical protein
MANNKRSFEDIDARLEALRSKLPRKEATTLQRYIDEFNQYSVTPLSKNTWKEAKECMDKIRKECIRVHGLDIWVVSAVADALKEKVKEFRVAAMQHNLDNCFDILEEHVQKKIFVTTSYNDEALTIAQYDDRKRAGYYFGGSISSNLTSYDVWKFDDGVRYDVLALDKGYGYSWEYFAPDASKEEMGSPSYPSTTTIQKVPLWRYLDICLCNPRVHRKDTLFEAVFDILETHIRTLKEHLETIDDDDHSFEQMVTDLHAFVR